MAAPDFPNSPTLGQTYTGPNGNIFTWDGAVWTTGGLLSVGSAAGGDLIGTYPNPTVGPLKITDAKVNDVAWGKITGKPASMPPSGPAGGALNGSYPNPGVVYGSISGIPASLPPSGAAGGSLVGSYPNPGIANSVVAQAQLVGGAAFRGATSATCPANASWGTANTWTRVLDLPQSLSFGPGITAWLFCSGTFVLVGNQGTTYSFYVGWGTGYAQPGPYWRSSAGTAGSLGTTLNFPANFMSWTSTGGLYSLWIYFTGGTVYTYDAPPTFSAWTMA